MAKQAADYLARMHFYTSDYYLDTETFRRLQVRFMNSKMRAVFDDMAFGNRDVDGSGKMGFELDPEYADYIRELVLDPKVVLERYKLRDLFMRKAEVLLHGDFHTPGSGSGVSRGEGRYRFHAGSPPGSGTGIPGILVLRRAGRPKA